MKAITLLEPWASLMAIGAKVNETRGVRTSHRGDICIHAAKVAPEFSQEVFNATVKAFRSRNLEPDPRTNGCIIAVVELWDVQPSENFQVSEFASLRSNEIEISSEEWGFGNYAHGRWIYRTRNLRRLETPVPCRGYQSIGWTVPPDEEVKVRAQLLIHRI